MNLLHKLTIKNLKLNKKRTIVMIIGIILSVSLITAVATMYTSAIQSLITFEIRNSGNYHVSYYHVPVQDIQMMQLNRDVEKLYLTQDVGFAKLEDCKNEFKPYAFVKKFSKESLVDLSINLIEGRLPKNDDEILIPAHLKTNGRIDLKVGEKITLDIGKRVSEDGFELNQFNPYNPDEIEKIIDTNSKTYTVVGKMERPADSIEMQSAPGYTFITTLNDKNMSGIVDVFARYNENGLDHYLETTANILRIDEKIFSEGYGQSFGVHEKEEANRFFAEYDKAKYEFRMNTYLIHLQTDPLVNNVTSGISFLAFIVCMIIMITSIFCIKNSFDISISEKIKQYGMLRSVGATKRQVRKNVLYEGFILGLIGIPLGLLLGLLASYILIIVSNSLLGEEFVNGFEFKLSISWIALLIAIILGSLTIYLSALRSANRAAKISPIESIRNSANIKIISKKVKSPKLIRKIFGIGGDISYKNMKRNKKKYRTTIVSIIVSVSIFIGLSFFMTSAFTLVNRTIDTYDYNIGLSANGIRDKKVYTKILSTISLENIEEYKVIRNGNVYIQDPKFTKAYKDLGENVPSDIPEDPCRIIAVNDDQFKKFIKSLHLDYSTYQDKAILAGDEWFPIYNEETGDTDRKYIPKYDYQSGDRLNLKYNEGKNEAILEIGHITKKSIDTAYKNETTLIVSEAKFEELFPNGESIRIHYQSNDPDKLQDDIDQILTGEDYYVNNIAANVRQTNNLFLLIAIFLYGFIIVITLIGITNIFNTITTNMNLRRQEFAMLRSIGMTKKEFHRMIRLESIFMGLKSLLFGIPIGLAISYLIYHNMLKESGSAFEIPFIPIVLAILGVYVLITLIMWYSISKIQKENIIETIRNENI